MIELPTEIDPLDATVIPDAVATSVHIVARARINKNNLVVMIGAGGGVGVHIIQLARLQGAEVVGFDLGEEKLRLIGDLGATPISSVTFSDLSGCVNRLAPSVVVGLVGSAESLTWGQAALGPGGRQVLLTTFPRPGIPHEPPSLSRGKWMSSVLATRPGLSSGKQPN